MFEIMEQMLNVPQVQDIETIVVAVFVVARQGLFDRKHIGSWVVRMAGVGDSAVQTNEPWRFFKGNSLIGLSMSW